MKKYESMYYRVHDRLIRLKKEIENGSVHDWYTQGRYDALKEILQCLDQIKDDLEGKHEH